MYKFITNSLFAAFILIAIPASALSAEVADGTDADTQLAQWEQQMGKNISLGGVQALNSIAIEIKDNLHYNQTNMLISMKAELINSQYHQKIEMITRYEESRKSENEKKESSGNSDQESDLIGS